MRILFIVLIVIIFVACSPPPVPKGVFLECKKSGGYPEYNSTSARVTFSCKFKEEEK